MKHSALSRYRIVRRRSFNVMIAGFIVFLNCAADGVETPRGQIAFVRGRFAMNDGKIHIVNADGSGLRIFARGKHAPRGEDHPTWSPKGDRIAFDAVRSGPARIFCRKADGTNKIALTPEPQLHRCVEPSWSPDGEQIVFCVCSADQKTSQIWIMRADGTDKQRLTGGNHHDWSPCFAADGYRIFFESTRDGDREVYVMYLDGSNQQNLTRNAETHAAPAASPDGLQVAFASRRNPEKLGISLMGRHGENSREITSDPSCYDSQPCWSPDGRWIAFMRQVQDPDATRRERSTSRYSIWVMQLDSLKARELTGGQVSTDSWAPSWGP